MKRKWRLALLFCWMLCCFCTVSFAEDVFQKEYIIYEENQLWGVKDESGAVIVYPQYREIAGFVGIYSRVTNTQNYVGLIDIYGNEIAPCIYDDVTIPEDGYYVALFSPLSEEEKDQYEFFFFDGTPTGWIFEYARGFHDSYATVIANGKEYLLDTEGTLHSIEPYHLTWGDGFSDGRLLVEKDGLYGYLNTSLQLVIPCIYDWADTYMEGTAKVEIDDMIMYIDKNGELVDDSSNNELLR